MRVQENTSPVDAKPQVFLMMPDNAVLSLKLQYIFNADSVCQPGHEGNTTPEQDNTAQELNRKLQVVSDAASATRWSVLT